MEVRHEQRNALFLRGLPGSRHVTAITAQSILHVFSRPGRRDALARVDCAPPDR
jgi:hypothetical protein